MKIKDSVSLEYSNTVRVSEEKESVKRDQNTNDWLDGSYQRQAEAKWEFN